MQINEKDLNTLNSSIEEAAKTRSFIDNVLGSEMKSLRERFEKIYLQEDYVEIFNRVKDSLHYLTGCGYPNEDSLGYLENRLKYISTGIKFLNFIEHEEIIADILSACGIKKIEFVEDFEQTYPTLVKHKEELKHIFNSANNTQGQICKGANEIKRNMYPSLPENLIKNTSKDVGISFNEFNTLVKIKSKENYKKKEKMLENLKEKNENIEINLDLYSTVVDSVDIS